ncbi:MAG TPA: rhodanese-like domain-containing protein [Patescibacteria group bacterium]
MNTKKIILLLVLTFFTGFTLGINFAPIVGSLTINYANSEINAPQLNSALSGKNFTLINVHTPYSGEIPSTDLFIPFDEMKANEDNLPKDKNGKIVLYCESGNMSKEALETLKTMGYTNVVHLKGGMSEWKKSGLKLYDLSNLPDKVMPSEGFVLPVNWGVLGPRLVSLGVIDKEKFARAVNLTEDQKNILEKGSTDPVKITSENSQFVVDFLWALGLAQKSLAYEEGPMGKEYKKDIGNFSSTAGWTLSQGNAVSHLGKHTLINLTDEQQKKVAEIAKNIYRPCCGNSTWFPDCNHGMAALAAIELMVSQDMPDEAVYKNVLKLNSFWFGSSYLTAATYFARQGIDWENVDAKKVLGSEFSSGSGAANIAQKVGDLPYAAKSSGGCGA